MFSLKRMIEALETIEENGCSRAYKEMRWGSVQRFVVILGSLIKLSCRYEYELEI